MIYAVVLAAGLARRMGEQKLTLPLADGTPMVRHVIQTALDSEVHRVCVVVQNMSGDVMNACEGLPVEWVVNPDAQQGMSTSLRAGIGHLANQSHLVQADKHRAAVVLLGDQPGISAATVNEIVAQYKETGAPVVQACYQGVFGHPVLFSDVLFPELMAVTGDQGGRDVVSKYRKERAIVHLNQPVPQDVDTPEDYQRLLGQMGK